MSNFRDRLRIEKQFNPFHKEFNYELLIKELAAWIQAHGAEDMGEISGMIETCQFFPVLHKFYTDILLETDRFIDHIGLSYETLMEILVAQNNGSHLFVLDQFRVNFRSKPEMHFSDTFAHRTNSIDPGIGQISTGGGLATLVDVLQLAMNSVKPRALSMPVIEPVSDEESMFYLNLLIKASNIYFGLKSSYEAAVWNGGHYEIAGLKKFRVTFADKDKLRNEEIGRFRLQQDSLATYLKMAEFLGAPGNEHAFSLNWNKMTRENVRIGGVSVVRGYVRYTLTTGTDFSELDDQLSHFAAMKTYYSFLENSKLPKLDPLRLWDIVLLFHLVQHLFTKVADLPANQDELSRIEDLFDYPFRIARKQLETYLQERTLYAPPVIHQFIGLITTPEAEWINFWNCPFMALGDDLLAPLLTITGPNIFYLIDHWLDKGGYSLDNRGTKLEAHISRNLNQQLQKKGYQHQIATRKKFKTKAGEKEEIDLVINLQTIVVIAEVKCIRYPMEMRDYYNNYDRLKIGSQQVIRKSAFLEKHADEFKKDIGDMNNKTIVRLVITNYPIFAGCSLDGIPVVDFHWLEGFVTHNKLIHYLSKNDGGRLVNEPQNALTLYNNETEFCANFEQQMRKPAIIERFREKVGLLDIKMTIEDFAFELYQETATFN